MSEPTAPPTPPTRWHRAPRTLAWGLALVPWPLMFWGAVLTALDREWFLCSPLYEAWLAGLPLCLGVTAASALYGLFGLILADGARGPFVAALLLPLGLAAAVTLGQEWTLGSASPGFHEYCSDGPDGRTLRLLGDAPPVKRVTPLDRSCTADDDCMAWPSGCCSWLGLNRRDTRPPGPGAECELACRDEPTGTRCVAGQCEVERRPANPPP